MIDEIRPSNIIVIEPHADDAFLSMGGHIKQWVKDGHRVEIITVYGNEKRMAEAAEYAKYLGASQFALNYPECNSTKGEAKKLLETDTFTMTGGVDEIYVPLGLFHTEHKEVRAWADREWGETGRLYYYLDMPYAVAQKNRGEVEARLRDLRVSSFLKPHASKFNATKIFKTQSMFFHFNDPKTLAAKTFEMTFRSY